MKALFFYQEGKTPLCEAITHNFKDIFDQLLEHRAKVNTTDKVHVPVAGGAAAGAAAPFDTLLHQDGRTPLYEAILGGNVEMVTALIEHGADIHSSIQVSEGEVSEGEVSEGGADPIFACNPDENHPNGPRPCVDEKERPSGGSLRDNRHSLSQLSRMNTARSPAPVAAVNSSTINGGIILLDKKKIDSQNRSNYKKS